MVFMAFWQYNMVGTVVVVMVQVSIGSYKALVGGSTVPASGSSTVLATGSGSVGKSARSLSVQVAVQYKQQGQSRELCSIQQGTQGARLYLVVFGSQAYQHDGLSGSFYRRIGTSLVGPQAYRHRDLSDSYGSNGAKSVGQQYNASVRVRVQVVMQQGVSRNSDRAAH